MNNAAMNKYGRRKASSWGAPKKAGKRIAHKANRRFKLKEDSPCI